MNSDLNTLELTLDRSASSIGFITFPFLLAGIDMLFTHIVIKAPQSHDSGYTFAAWFLIVTGVIGVYSAMKSSLNPSKILIADRNGISLYVTPFSSKPYFIQWNDIEGIKETVVSNPQDNMPVGSSLIPALLIVLRPNSNHPKSKITTGVARWHNNCVKLEARMMSLELDRIIPLLNSLRTGSPLLSVDE